MANVLAPQHPQLSFNPPVTHSPLATAPSPTIMAQRQGQSSASPSSGQRSQKRKHEVEEDYERNDVVMDRSPTPERRPKRGPPKRLRVMAADGPNPQEANVSNSNQDASAHEEIDVGVLLATLPPQSLLPILTSLVEAHPNLKPEILHLIPKPTVEAAVQAIQMYSKKLKDAYPYSNPAPVSVISTSFSFGSAVPISRSGGFGSALNQVASPKPTNGMRNEYIISRMRPHVSEFASSCFAYLPYFSSASQSSTNNTRTPPPFETFTFLQTLTNQILAQPPITRDLLAAEVLPRLQTEWQAWTDLLVTHAARFVIYGQQISNIWLSYLEEVGQAVDGTSLAPLQHIRDNWAAKLAWCAGRTTPQSI